MLFLYSGGYHKHLDILNIIELVYSIFILLEVSLGRQAGTYPDSLLRLAGGNFRKKYCFTPLFKIKSIVSTTLKKVEKNLCKRACFC